jgi:DNA invertase Pin-like site-specific DNA recombinase
MKAAVAGAVMDSVYFCHLSAELRAAGCGKVFAEKVSGAKSHRVELVKLLKRLAPGDTVMVTRLHRLARSTRDLLNILDSVSKADAKFRSLHDSWADTTTPHGELMVTILGGLATFERHLIKARTDDGRKRATAQGVPSHGSPPADDFHRVEVGGGLPRSGRVRDHFDKLPTP